MRLRLDSTNIWAGNLRGSSLGNIFSGSLFFAIHLAAQGTRQERIDSCYRLCDYSIFRKSLFTPLFHLQGYVGGYPVAAQRPFRSPIQLPAAWSPHKSNLRSPRRSRGLTSPNFRSGSQAHRLCASPHVLACSWCANSPKLRYTPSQNEYGRGWHSFCSRCMARNAVIAP
jgi:hypothetical protein